MKQEATFGWVIGWIDAGAKGIAAQLSDVTGHPRLGNEHWVRTSRVERIGYSDNGEVNEVETRNTIYTRA